MERYIALLRGVNVSGKNKISMSDLKSAFEEHGFQNVRTYINSGNVIFSSELQNRSEITNQCETIIADTFNARIPVLVLPPNELSDILAHAPDWWDTEDKDIYNNMIFVIPPTSVEEVYGAIGEAKPEYEQVGHYKNAIFWSFTRKHYSKTQWIKTASTSVNDKVTIRNANTVKKLLELV